MFKGEGEGRQGDPYLLRGINCNCTSETETETLSRLSCCCDATRRRCDGLNLGGYGQPPNYDREGEILIVETFLCTVHSILFGLGA